MIEGTVSEVMSLRHYPVSPLLAACTAIWCDDKILLVMRRSPPNAGKWGMPGGLVEVGETLEQAAIREVGEETGLYLNQVVFNRFDEIIIEDDAGKIERHYVLAMFVATSHLGEATAGDDAEIVRWFTREDLRSEPLIGNTGKFAKESLLILPQFN